MCLRGDDALIIRNQNEMFIKPNADTTSQLKNTCMRGDMELKIIGRSLCCRFDSHTPLQVCLFLGEN